MVHSELWINRDFTPPPPEEQDRRIAALKERMQTHDGELVLVENRYYEAANRSEDQPRSLETERYLGLTQAPYLTSAQNGLLTVHTPRYALSRFHDWCSPDSTIWVTVANLGPTHPYLPPSGIGAPLRERRSRFNRNTPLGSAVEIIVGDEAVASWVEQQTQGERVAPLLVFYRLIRALGREAALPKILDAKLQPALTNKKLEILEQLRVANDHYESLRERSAKPNQIHLPRVQIGIDDGTYDRQVREDEADLQIIQSGLAQQHLRMAYVEITQALQRAKGYYMDQDPWIFTTEPSPGITVTTDVPTFIGYLYEKYGISLPKENSLT